MQNQPEDQSVLVAIQGPRSWVPADHNYEAEISALRAEIARLTAENQSLIQQLKEQNHG
jgi:hypothetical protein